MFAIQEFLSNYAHILPPELRSDYCIDNIFTHEIYSYMYYSVNRSHF